MGFFDFFKKKKSDELSEEQVNHKTLKSDEVEKDLAEKALKIIASDTETPCVRLTLTKTKPTVFESKVGGLGYIPHDGNFPADSKGNQLRLLAQLDCSQVKLEEFPKRGLLQFWISDDDCWGLEFENSIVNDCHRVIYYPDTDKSVTEEEIKSKIIPNEYEADSGENYMPVNGEYGLQFEYSKESLSDNDCRFRLKFCNAYNSFNPPKTIESPYDLNTDIGELESFEKLGETAFGHKIGGYPGFTQEDPRDEYSPCDFLLLQLDSEFGEGEDKIMWGDAGICNFFINREKLKNLDFSEVMYNWDCY